MIFRCLVPHKGTFQRKILILTCCKNNLSLFSCYIIAFGFCIYYLCVVLLFYRERDFLSKVVQ